MPTEKTIKEWMRNSVHEHIPYTGGEVNMTALAEDALNHFAAHVIEPDSEEEQLFFDYAFDISEEYLPENRDGEF